MNIPIDLLYTNEHEWIRVDDEHAYIGITDYAQSELGDIVFVEFPNITDSYIKEEVFGTIEAVKTVADLFMPISGTIMSVNESLESKPELINSDPYNDGWLVKIAIKDKSELASLLDNEAYKGIISNA